MQKKDKVKPEEVAKEKIEQAKKELADIEARIAAAKKAEAEILMPITPKTTDKKKAEPKDLEWQKARDKELVKGILESKKGAGGVCRFSYKKYKGDPIENYELYEGQMYTIPRGVAEHINQNTWYPVNKHSVDESGKPNAVLGQKVRRFIFRPLDFMDLNDINELEARQNDIVTVKNI